MDNTSESLISMEALEWLRSIKYEKLDHANRMKVIEAAKIAYPSEECDEHQSFFATLGLV